MQISNQTSLQAWKYMLKTQGVVILMKNFGL